MITRVSPSGPAIRSMNQFRYVGDGADPRSFPPPPAARGRIQFLIIFTGGMPAVLATAAAVDAGDAPGVTLGDDGSFTLSGVAAASGNIAALVYYAIAFY